MKSAWPAPAAHQRTRQWLTRVDSVVPPSRLSRMNEFSPVMSTVLGSTGWAITILLAGCGATRSLAAVFPAAPPRPRCSPVPRRAGTTRRPRRGGQAGAAAPPARPAADDTRQSRLAGRSHPPLRGRARCRPTWRPRPPDSARRPATGARAPAHRTAPQSAPSRWRLRWVPERARRRWRPAAHTGPAAGPRRAARLRPAPPPPPPPRRAPPPPPLLLPQKQNAPRVPRALPAPRVVQQHEREQPLRL